MHSIYRNLLLVLAAWFCAMVSPALAQGSGQEVAQGSEPYVYQIETDAIPPGSGSDTLDLTTPMGLAESFMAAGADNRWKDAAATLDTTLIEPAPSDAQRRRLARQMYDLLHRSIAIDWGALPDRPDAVDIQTSSEDPMAGTARRSITLARLDLADRTVPVRIARVQVDGGEPIWLFSRQTVANLPALHREYGPTRFERSLPPALREQAFWKLAWWEVIAIPLMIVVAAAAAALTYAAIRRWKHQRDEKDKWYGVLDAVHLPATLLALAGTFALLRELLLNLSGPVRAFLDPLQLILVVVAILGIVLAALDALFDFATDRRTDELEDPQNSKDRDFYTKLSGVRRILMAVLFVAALGIILIASNISDTLGFSILASAGLIGLVLVFAARAMLSDIMASVQIAFAQTARIGDAVLYEGEWCYVEKIGFTHLRLRTWDERRMIAPVASFIGSSFENWTKQDPSLMMTVALELDNRADVEALRKPFREFIENDDDVIDREDAKVQVIDQTAKAKVVRFMARAPDPKTGWNMHCRLREHMLAEASKLEATNEPVPAYFSREREVRLDVPMEDGPTENEGG